MFLRFLDILKSQAALDFPRSRQRLQKSVADHFQSWYNVHNHIDARARNAALKGFYEDTDKTLRRCACGLCAASCSCARSPCRSRACRERNSRQQRPADREKGQHAQGARQKERHP
ncbi:MAG: hypothetical protein SO031_09355 [Candidatus Ventricola sp.]|nr:hypothetical protein [Candidatus Ventricola sp.]